MATPLSMDVAKTRALIPLLAQIEWSNTARKAQRTPAGDWRIWLVLAGRGWGKTRTGAQDVALYGLRHPGVRIAVVAPTYQDPIVAVGVGLASLLGVFTSEKTTTK